MRHSVTEYVDVDLTREVWVCNRCEHELGPAEQSFKVGCLLRQRDPAEIWQPLIEGDQTFTYNPGWARIVECYCPGCGTMIETELLPPGHALTHDIELDIEALRARLAERQEETR